MVMLVGVIMILSSKLRLGLQVLVVWAQMILSFALNGDGIHEFLCPIGLSQGYQVIFHLRWIRLFGVEVAVGDM